MLSKFERSSLTAEGWISIIQEAVLSNGEEEFAWGQSEKEESSTIASKMDAASTFDFQWCETLDELDTEGSPTASAHRTALELLGRFLISSTKSTAMGSDPSREYLTGLVVKLMT